MYWTWPVLLCSTRKILVYWVHCHLEVDLADLRGGESSLGIVSVTNIHRDHWKGVQYWFVGWASRRRLPPLPLPFSLSPDTPTPGTRQRRSARHLWSLVFLMPPLKNGSLPVNTYLVCKYVLYLPRSNFGNFCVRDWTVTFSVELGHHWETRERIDTGSIYTWNGSVYGPRVRWFQPNPSYMTLGR